MKVVGNSQYQKIANSFLILRLLRGGTSTRVEIARKLGLQPSTVTYSVNRLLESGLVRESNHEALHTDSKPSNQGRKAVQIELNVDYGRVIGLELLADYCWCSILDLRGNVLFSQRLEYLSHTENLPPKKRFELQLERVINKMVNLCNGIPVLGVGIALPGIVEANGQIVRDCWTHELKECDFSQFLKDRFAFPVVFENDANCCVQKYLWNGADERQTNFIYLLAREYPHELVPKGVPPFGIGLGLVFEGKLYRGSHSMAGEFISAFMDMYSQTGQLQSSVENMLVLQLDSALRQKMLKELLYNLRSIVSILDPQTVYLGGFFTDYMDEATNILNEDLLKKVIFVNAHSDASEGAAENLLNLLFRIPQVGETENESTYNQYLLFNHM
ncbi:MAG: ROK family transcriptional regulator [Spirochaetia bacterium]|nr:ROK family transcriptional regulator [Spirochaetia bacterium]